MSIGLLAYLNGHFYLAGTSVQSLIEDRIYLATTGDIRTEKDGEVLDFKSFFAGFLKSTGLEKVNARQLKKKMESKLSRLIKKSYLGNDIELHCLFAGFLPSEEMPVSGECVIRYGVVTIELYDIQELADAHILRIGNFSSIDRIILGAEPMFLTLGLRKIRQEILLPHYAGIIERDTTYFKDILQQISASAVKAEKQITALLSNEGISKSLRTAILEQFDTISFDDPHEKTLAECRTILKNTQIDRDEIDEVMADLEDLYNGEKVPGPIFEKSVLALLDEAADEAAWDTSKSMMDSVLRRESRLNLLGRDEDEIIFAIKELLRIYRFSTHFIESEAVDEPEEFSCVICTPVSGCRLIHLDV